LIPARRQGLLWESVDGEPINKPPEGIKLHCCPLALIRYHKGEFTLLSDCRRFFPAITDLGTHEHVREQAQEVKIELILGSGENVPYQKLKIPKFGLINTSRIEILVNEPKQIKEIDKIELLKDRDVKEIAYHNGTIKEAWFLWRPVTSFYGAAPNDRIYMCLMDDDGNTWVQFGDGKTGARLPAGVDNVKLIYRTGIGARNGLLHACAHLQKIKYAKLLFI